MKKIFLASLLISIALPVMSSAHGGDMMDSTDPGLDMMRTIEDRAVGDELHEEMENLMIKMVSGDMTETEIERMVTLMDRYPGVHGMVMGRVVGGNFVGTPFGGMMRVGGSFWAWIMILGMMVWLSVGILLIALLLRKLIKS